MNALAALFDAWGLPVAIQRRQPGSRPPATDHPRRFPEPPVGGDSGIVAIPSRIAARDHSIPGTVQVSPSPGPRINGAWGPVGTMFRGLFDWSQGAGPFPWPGGRYTVAYHRQPHPNVAPLSEFSTPIAGPVDATINYPEEARTMPYAPIPYSDHRITATFRQLFDQRIHADYLPPERLQMGAPVHGGQGQGAQMIVPYFPRLTRWIAPGSYGQQTQVLQPEGA